MAACSLNVVSRSLPAWPSAARWCWVAKTSPCRGAPSRPPRSPARLARLDAALATSADEIAALRKRTAETLGEELAKIFAFHLGMLADPTLTGGFHEAVRTRTGDRPVRGLRGDERLRPAFLAHEDRYFRDRVTDVYDLQRRILRHLTQRGVQDLASVTKPAVVIARDLTPSQTAGLDPKLIKGLATDLGGHTSHTAILAHALGIPAVVGMEDLTLRVRDGDSVILDGNRGVVVAEPGASQLLEYRQEIRRLKRQAAELQKLRDVPAVTRDGVVIELNGNIEFPHEVPDALDKGALAIGLYRTEFVYLAADHEPDEEEQYRLYAEAVRLLEGRPLTFRTLDLGADKMPESVDLGLVGGRRGQPLPGLPIDPPVPAEPADVPHAAAGHPPGQRHRARADHVSHDQQRHGAAAGQDDPARRPGRPDRTGHRLRRRHPRGHDDRGSLGRHSGQNLRRRGRFLQHRHQRPDPVHRGGGPRQRAGRQPLLRRASRGTFAD